MKSDKECPTLDLLFYMQHTWISILSAANETSGIKMCSIWYLTEYHVTKQRFCVFSTPSRRIWVYQRNETSKTSTYMRIKRNQSSAGKGLNLVILFNHFLWIFPIACLRKRNSFSKYLKRITGLKCVLLFIPRRWGRNLNVIPGWERHSSELLLKIT